jgi:Na+-driven multidrug efflux pump
MATEAISGFGSFRKWFHTLPASAESSYVLTTQRAAMFYLPLVVASLTGAFAYSIINAGLARMADPRSVIATFAIANVVTYLLLGPLFMLHQVSLFFGAMPGVPGSRERNALVKRFCLWIGFIATAILGLLAWTPLGDWLLLRAFQSPSALLPLVKQVLRVSMFVPLVVAWNEYRTGRLLAAGRSRTMTAAKFCNLAMLAATMLAVTKLAPRMGAVAAPIAVLCALTAEQLVLLRATARMRKEGTDGN